jgi:epoxyqueuosine reductase
MTPIDHEALRQRIRAIGFDEVRFAQLPDPGVGAGLGSWLKSGYHADMNWLARNQDKRENPELILPGARSLILLGVNYWSGKRPVAEDARAPRWARYSLYEDYHDTLRAGLVTVGRLLEETCGVGADDYRYYVDTGPVLERGWAARSGMGFTGKNAMLISRRHGNWLFLASLVTRIILAADPPIRLRREEGDPLGAQAGLLCGRCTRCLDACPTQAFAAPGVVDSRRCVSYQTIENKGLIPRELRAGIGSRIYGCDVCLEVCPWNRFAREGRRQLLSAREELRDVTLAELLTLTPDSFARIFRRTPIKRAKLGGILRNACIVAGNTGDVSYLPALTALARHALPLVRAHAVWAVYRLGGGDQLGDARSAETSPEVRAEYAAENAVVDRPDE